MIIDREQKDELDRFNEKWDSDYAEISNKFAEQEAKLKEEQQRELDEKIEEFEKSYPRNPKHSNELLNNTRVFEQAVRQKEY